jgi:YHS domain-containing protein
MSVRSLTHILLAGLLGLAAIAAAASPKSSVNKDDNGIAIKGYDVVAYAVVGAPAKGSPEFQHTWSGAIWLFASAGNRDRFVKQPEKYAPQFGGYCSWAVSRNYTADVDPEAWTIVDGRLYLNYSTSVQRRWEQDVPGNIQKAQANWPGVLNK